MYPGSSEIPFPKQALHQLNQHALRKISGPYILGYQLFMVLLFYTATEELQLLLAMRAVVRGSWWRLRYTYISQGLSQCHDR